MDLILIFIVVMQKICVIKSYVVIFLYSILKFNENFNVTYLFVLLIFNVSYLHNLSFYFSNFILI